MNFLLDTDTCSFLINGSAEQARRKFLGALDSEVRMSIITLGELLVGCALRVKDSELRDRISAGDTDAQAVAFIVDRYGEYVLLAPRANGSALVVWLAGPAALLLGGGLAFQMLRRRARAAGPEALTPEEEQRLAKVLADTR